MAVRRAGAWAVAAVVATLGMLSMGAVSADAATPIAGHVTVRGTVLKANGNPLTNARVGMGIGDCENPNGCGTDSYVTTKTDAEGHYTARLGVYRLNDHVTVSVTGRGPYSGANSEYFTITPGRTYTKNLTVHEQSQIVGKVTDSAGNPLSVVIQAYGAKTGTLKGATGTFAGTGGYFHLTLNVGSYKLKLLYDTNASAAGGVVSQWYDQAGTSAAATTIHLTSGEKPRVNPVFVPYPVR